SVGPEVHKRLNAFIVSCTHTEGCVGSVSERLAYFSVPGGGMLWGTTGPARTFVADTADAFVAAARRLAIGGVVLMMSLAFSGVFKFSNWPWKYIWIVSLALALFQYSFFTSVRLTGVAVGTVVTIGSSPIFTGLLESIFLRARPTRQWFVATSLAVIGCA